MRKALLPILIIPVIGGIIFGFAGCRQNKNGVRNGKINVTAVNFAPYDFVREIAGEQVNLVMLLPPGAESHSFEPSPQDIITIQKSDIFIFTGGESDAWIERILASMDVSKIKIVRMMDVCSLVEEEIVEGMESDEDEDEDEIVYDEHVWTSPENAIRIVQAIRDALCDADAANAALYRRSAAAYINELAALDADFQKAAAEGKRKTIVFGDRFPFRYLADRCALTYYAAFPGCSTETEPGAATVAFLINKIKAEKIPVVFHIELSNERMADAIAAETGAKKLLLHACHNISKKDFNSGVSYLDLMRGNVNALREALQ
jgi:zinc transport system substrate-binding protein